VNVALSMIMFHLSKRFFDEVGLEVRQNRLGFIGYLLTYQLFMSSVSAAGSAQELFGAALVTPIGA
jgi:biofilm PGA synthesis N-glycosyltransferase PgaC